jgi:O-antigen/teichoic acid export membrane protein
MFPKYITEFVTWRTDLELTAEFKRGRQRIRRINLTAVASIGFRGAMLLSSFLYIPATVHYLGPDRYGLWVAMTSIITLLAFADCGLGFSLMNDVAYSIGRGSDDLVRKAISSAFFSLSAIGVSGCVIFWAAYHVIPWQALFQTRTSMEADEASRAIAVIVIGFLITLPFTTVQRMQSAYQEGYKTQAWEIGGVMLSLVGLLLAIRGNAGLPTLAIAFSFGPLIAMVLNWAVYFSIHRPSQFPVWRFFEFHSARLIAGQGWYFFLLQIAGIAVFSIDSFVILHYFGQAAFGKYSLVVKLFQIVPALAGVWMAALWPAYAEAIGRGDSEWVKRTLVRSTCISAAASAVVSCGVAVLSRAVIQVWTGMDVSPSAWLLGGLVLYSVIVTGCGAIAAFLNGSGFIKGQALLALISASLAIPLKVVLCRYWEISGAIWATNLAYVFVIIPALLVIVPDLVRRCGSTEGGGCVHV